MRLSRIILSLATLLPLTTADAVGPDDPLAPWQITKLTTFSPSGRPGSSPYSLVNLTIADPNQILAGSAPTVSVSFPPNSANCSVAFAAAAAPPWGQVVNCTEQSWPGGYWSFELLEPADAPSATEHFDVRFALTDWTHSSPELNFRQSFTGTASFQVGVNLAGVCGASGVCSWGLKAEARPVLVTQTRTECQGLCKG